MPRSLDAPVVQPHNVMYKGEAARTRFVDWLDAIQVELKHGPGPTIYQGMAEMQQASYSPDHDLVVERAIQAVAEGTYGSQPLPLNLEVPSFLFLVKGVSRAMTHQIVRTRVGVTYAQKCTGDGDIRHDDALVPRSLNKPGSEPALRQYVDIVLQFKEWYSREVDSGFQSIHVLRYLMPHCLSQYIYVNISLLALKELYGKRMCPEQPIEWQRIAGGMKAALEKDYPGFAKLLRANCETKSCHWHRRGNNDPMIGRLYFPDMEHDVEPWNPESFMHQGTVWEVLGGPPFATREYSGWVRVK